MIEFYLPRPPDSRKEIWNQKWQNNCFLQQLLCLNQICNVIPEKRIKIEIIMQAANCLAKRVVEEGDTGLPKVAFYIHVCISKFYVHINATRLPETFYLNLLLVARKLEHPIFPSQIKLKTRNFLIFLQKN